MKKILVTGHLGFIGGSILKSLDSKEYQVFTFDYRDPDPYVTDLSSMDIVIHMGAESSTNSKDGDSLFNKNIVDTVKIFSKAKNAKIIYASSASTYGTTNNKSCENDTLCPESLYAKSKAIIDDIVLNYLSHRKIVGLRFFNVCSFFSEENKIQPSPTFLFLKQLKNSGEINLFYGSDIILRDFIYIDDVVDIVHFFIKNKVDKSVVVNVGTGDPISFEQIADKLICNLGFGKKNFIDKPLDILNSYQEYTEADLSLLRNLGYNKNIPNIIGWIDKKLCKKI